MENLGIDIKLLIAQIINFALFFYIFKKFIAEAFLKFLRLEKEKGLEKERIELDLKQKEEKWKQQELKFKKLMKSEEERTLRLAKDTAEKMKEDIIKKANNEAIILYEKAKKAVEEEKKLAEKDIEKKVIDLSIAIIETSLKNYLTPEIKKEITNKMIKNLPSVN